MNDMMRNCFIIPGLTIAIAGAMVTSTLAESGSGDRGTDFCDQATLTLKDAWQRGHDLPADEFKHRLDFDKIEAAASSGDTVAILSKIEAYGAGSKEAARLMLGAAFAGDADSIVAMVNAGVSPDGAPPKFVPAVAAAQCGRTVALESLINHGADVHMQEVQGLDPMMTAIATSNTEAATLLVSAGYDPCRNRTKDDRSVHDLIETANRDWAEFGMRSDSCD